MLLSPHATSRCVLPLDSSGSLQLLCSDSSSIMIISDWYAKRTKSKVLC